MSPTRTSSPTGRSPATRDPTTSRTRSARRARQRPARDRHADARARARLGVHRASLGRRRRARGAGRRDGARRPRLTEGTELRDAIELSEAAERLGASLHAESGWDATSAGVDVPASRLGSALELLAEILRRPAFPESEIDRLRDERLTDILQAKADPRRRADEAYIGTIYAPSSPYHRPSGGTTDTVSGLTPAELRRSTPGRRCRTARPSWSPATLTPPTSSASPSHSFWATGPAATPPTHSVDDTPARAARVVRVFHRPGAVQTEIRIGHPALPRRHADYHAVSVMGAILGGLFNSRLNMKLREEKGYTYGASAGFDLRRGRGPFTARAAVNTEVTVPAIGEFLTELDRIREEPVTDAELTAARDFLMACSRSGSRRRVRSRARWPGCSSTACPMTSSTATGAPSRPFPRTTCCGRRAHIRPEAAAIVVVGDADQFGYGARGGGGRPPSRSFR